MSWTPRTLVTWLPVVSLVAAPPVLADELPSLRAVGQPIPGPSSTPEYPVVINLAPYVAGLMTLDATIGERVVPLIFDTAGGLSLVTPPVAESIGCEPFGRVVGHRSNGDAVVVERCGEFELEISGWTFRDRVAVWDLMALLEGAPEVGGLVGLTLFQGQAITIELARARVTVESGASLPDRVRDMRPLRLRPARQAGGATLDVFVGIEVGSELIWFELDSGNTGPVLIAPHAADQLGLELSDNEPRAVTLPVAGLGERPVNALERDIIYDGLLNAEFLAGLVITLDLDAMRGWAQPVAGDGPPDASGP